MKKKSEIDVNLPATAKSVPEIVDALFERFWDIGAKSDSISITKSFNRNKINIISTPTADIYSALRELGISEDTAKHIKRNSEDIVELKQQIEDLQQQLDAVKNESAEKKLDIHALHGAMNELYRQYSSFTEQQKAEDKEYQEKLADIQEEYAAEISRISAFFKEWNKTTEQTISDIQDSIARGISDVELAAKKQNEILIKEIDDLKRKIRDFKEEIRNEEARKRAEEAARSEEEERKEEPRKRIEEKAATAAENYAPAKGSGNIAQTGGSKTAGTKGLTYELSEGGKSYICTGIGSATATEIEIASWHDGLWVTGIAENAFKDYSSITKITIPNSVTSIGKWAFSGCSYLKSITIPNGVTSIGLGVFSGCSSFTKITIPNGVTSIEDGAFIGCSSLREITISDSVTSIGGGVFSGCSSLTSITVESDNPRYHSAGNCLIETATKTLVVGCKSSVIQSGRVTSIGEMAFFGCSSLTEITIPNSVKSIGKRAFFGCSSLINIIFKGTKKEWKAIKKKSRWDSNTGNYTVYCSGGKMIPKSFFLDLFGYFLDLFG